MAEKEALVNRLIKDAVRAVEQYNTVFRQASSNLIVASGILLALSTQLVSQLQKAELAVRILALLIVTSLTLSIAFGVTMQLLEAKFFRKLATKRLRIINDIQTQKLDNEDKIEGVIEEAESQLGNAVSLWPLIVQISFLALSFVLIIVVTAVYLLA